MKLYDYQEECLSLMFPAAEKGGRFGVKLPTGSGKTVIFSNFVSKLKNKNILILVHRDELINQTIKKLNSFGIKARIEKAESSATDEHLEILRTRLARTKGLASERIDKISAKIKAIEAEIPIKDQELIDRTLEAKIHEKTNQTKYDAWLKKEEDYEKTWGNKSKKALELKAALESAFQIHETFLETIRSIQKEIDEMPIGSERILKKRKLADYQTKKALEIKESKINVRAARAAIKFLKANRPKHKEYVGAKPVIVNIPLTRINNRVDSLYKQKEINLENIERLKKILETKGPETPEDDCVLVIASAQTLRGKRLDKWDRNLFDIIIFDEGHHLVAPSWKNIQLHFITKANFAFSATLKPREIRYEMLYEKDLITIMDLDYLSKVEHIRLDVRERKIKPDSTQHDDQILAVLNEYPKEKTIVFCASLRQAIRLATVCQLPCAVITGHTKKIERRQIVTDFASKKISVLFNFLVVYEGFDDPGSTMIIAKTTQSADTYMQTTGRGLRKDGLKKAKIVDIITRDDQMTLPTIFGLHKDWEFEGDPLEDAKAAKKYATTHNLDLPKYQNWGFLRLKRPYTPERRTRRDIQRGFHNMKGNELKILSSTGKYVTAVAPGGSHFYHPKEALRKYVNEALKSALNIKPVKSIDPSTITQVTATSIEQKRFLAAKYARQYGARDGFLRNIHYKSKKWPLSEAQCDAAIRIAKEMAASDAELEIAMD
jgi:superfamily II DNA or RNA helicase